MAELDGGWGDVSEDDTPPRGVDTATGEILEEDPQRIDPSLLKPGVMAARIADDPDAIQMLKEALGLGPEKPDKLRVFASLDQFVEKYFVRVFQVHLTSRISWCDQWWEHPEGHVALDALWELFEVSRGEAGGQGRWLHHYWWPYWDRLLAPDTSPYAGCKHTVTDPAGNITQEPEHNPHHMQRLPVGIPEEGIFKVYPTKANPNP